MKQAISLLLAALLLFALPVTSFAAAPAKPDVSIAVNNIKDETMEVSIMVGSGNFKATGAVLQYDAAKLQPIRWSTTAAISVPKDPATPEAGWAAAAVIESICPDNLAGKPAMAYQSGGTGYLYVGAEAAAAQEFTAPTAVVTVRFAYLESKSETRFSTAAATVKFAADNDVSFASPVKGSMIYQTENRSTGEYRFYYLNPLTDLGGGAVTDPSVPGEDLIPAEPAVTPDKDGETANKGEASTDDFVSVTFYDWDGQLLGSRIIAKGTGSLTDPNTTSNRALYVNADGTAKYTDLQLTQMNVAPLVPQGETLTGAVDKSGNAVSTVNKEGYTFAGWVDYSDYSTPNVDIASSDRNNIPEASLVALSGLTQNLTLKAAYNETGTSTGGNSTRRYDLYYSPFKNNAQKTFLETTITVVRKPEARKTSDGKYLVISLRPLNAGETRVRIELGDKDIETYTLSMPTKAADTYMVSNALSLSLQDGTGTTRSSGVTIKAEEIIHH